jgi:hypothetical protein
MNRRVLIQILFTAAAGAGFLYFGYVMPATILCVMAGLLVTLATLAPSVFQTLQELGTRFGALVGSAIGVVSLTLIYCSVFLLGSLWLRLRGIDPLNRLFPGDGGSNWIDRMGFGTDKTLYSKPYTHPHGDRRARGSEG